MLQKDLADHPKNTHQEIDAVWAKMAQMKDWFAEACSAKWVDKENLLVAYFSDHITDAAVYQHIISLI